ncbi:MAG: DUF3568 family protein [Nitrospira sp.]|nr:DUF3568 family protein [Nitrospira sp.]
MKRTKKLIFLAVSLFFLYGCELALLGLGAGGGVAGYKYYEGHASTELPLKYSRAWQVTNTALENLNISISSSDNRDTQGTITGLQKDGKNVSIKLKERSQWVTTISVRVGKFGDRGDADIVLDEITSVAGL